MAATLPLPMAASGFRVAIAAKELVRSLTEIFGTEADELLGLLELLPAGGVLEEELLHAATARQAATGSAAMAPFLALINHLMFSVGVLDLTLELLRLTWP